MTTFRTILDDAAEAEQGYQNAIDLLEDENLGSIDEEQLAKQFQEILRGAEEADLEAPTKKSRTAATASRSKRSTSMFNESTIWFGRTPLVQRTDTPAT